MRVLAVGEGIHERGDGEVDGALAVLLRRILPRISRVELRQPADPAIKVTAGRGDRLGKRALGWMRYAVNDGYDALVFLIDADGDPARAKSLGLVQTSEAFALPRAVGVAVEKFDAWMLADNVALSSVLGHDIPTQPMPESLTDAKERMIALVGGSPNEASLRRVYSEIAATADLSVIERRCPKGFGTFALRVRSLGG